MTDLFVNGRFLLRPVTGVERYARGVLGALDRRLERKGHTLPQRVDVLVPRGHDVEHPWKRIRIRSAGRLQGQAWEQLDLPRIVGRRPLLNLCNLAPLLASNQMTIIHDAGVFAVPEAFAPTFRRYYRTMLPLIARRSREIGTVSEFSSREIDRWLGPVAASITVAPPGLGSLRATEPDAGALHRFALQPGAYVLGVGSLDPRKNIAALAEAARANPTTRFVLAGGANAQVFASAGVTLPENVVMTGYVSDSALRALYEHARMFVFPSRYEGFGMPPLEAMDAGCPVVVSRAAALPEACGDAALYCDADDPRTITSAIERLQTDDGLRAKLISRGRHRAAARTWDACLDRLLPALERLTS